MWTSLFLQNERTQKIGTLISHFFKFIYYVCYEHKSRLHEHARLADKQQIVDWS